MRTIHACESVIGLATSCRPISAHIFNLAPYLAVDRRERWRVLRSAALRSHNPPNAAAPPEYLSRFVRGRHSRSPKDCLRRRDRAAIAFVLVRQYERVDNVARSEEWAEARSGLMLQDIVPVELTSYGIQLQYEREAMTGRHF
jgi:hypothetical protein